MAGHFDITQIGFSAEPEVIIKQNDEGNCIDMIQHFNAINIEFLTEPEVKKPKLSDDVSFTSYAYLKKSNSDRGSVMLNLRLKVNLPNEIEAMDYYLKLKLDLKQKKRRDNSTRYFKQTLL